MDNYEYLKEKVDGHETILAPAKKEGLVQTVARLEMRDASRNKVLWIIVSAIVGICIKMIFTNMGW